MFIYTVFLSVRPHLWPSLNWRLWISLQQLVLTLSLSICISWYFTALLPLYVHLKIVIFQVWAGPGLEKCSNQCYTELFQQTHITYVDPWAPSSLIWSNLIWTESTAVVSLWAFQQCWLSTCEWKSFVVIVKQPSWWAFSITSITLVNVRTLYTSETLDLWRANETMWLWLIFYHYWVFFAEENNSLYIE